MLRWSRTVLRTFPLIFISAIPCVLQAPVDQVEKDDLYIRQKWSGYAMPSKPTKYTLSEEEQTAPYGLKTKVPTPTLDVGVAKFLRHCTDSINLDRGTNYIEPIQSTTVPGIQQVIKGFMGFCHEYEGVPYAELRLSLFSNPDYIVDFVGFLMARDVGHAQIAKQVCVSLCK